jgi:hypothetical protein
MELNAIQCQNLMRRFPQFELSYETISHKKVSLNYNITLAIPAGKKFFAWFTFYKNMDVCYLMELNRDKKVSKISRINTIFQPCLSLGTVLYGTILDNADPVDEKKFFVIEDIFSYKGISIGSFLFSEKLGYLQDFMKNQIVQRFASKNGLVFALPSLWYNHQPCDFECNINIPDKISADIGYTIHHLQYRMLSHVAPYLNISLTRKINTNTNVQTDKNTETQMKTPGIHSKPVIDFSKPQYKYPTTFHVIADIQFDIYHLFAFGKNKSLVYYNVACISDYKTSIFMNGLFRNIRENKNLDYIEESDDEDDFENVAEDRYVDVNKTLLIECIFSPKFKKWIPRRVMPSGSMVVHINKLANIFNQ